MFLKVPADGAIVCVCLCTKVCVLVCTLISLSVLRDESVLGGRRKALAHLHIRGHDNPQRGDKGVLDKR